MKAEQLVEAFNDCFLASFNTCLKGGGDEPLYLPANENRPATIIFRCDYPSSALHEVSHWCIAGVKRRQLEDYGYWYEPDTRDGRQQSQFEKVEVSPQAIECILHWAAGLAFRVSVDNLAMPDYDARPFERAVIHQVGQYLTHGLPSRAVIFSKCLFAQRCPDLLFEEFITQHYEDYCRRKYA